MIVANKGSYVKGLRLEIIEKLIEQNYIVSLVFPKDENVNFFKEIGCKHYDIELSGRGTNVVDELNLVRKLKAILKEEKPDFILTYTIKPNLYISYLAKKLKIPYLPNITGLGGAIHNKGILKIAIIYAYRFVLTDAKAVFFQNEHNKNFFIENNIIKNNQARLLPGSGVNIHKFPYSEYQVNNKKKNIVFIGRVMKEKGIEEFVRAAKIVATKHKNVFFDIYGAIIEKEYLDFEKYSYIKFHGEVSDVKEVIKNAYCIVLPSYHEGMANVLLESASMGRITIATRIPGCQEIILDETTGYLVEKQNVNELVNAFEKVINLDRTRILEMSINSRKHIKENFDRDIVVNSYMNEIM